VKTQVAHRPRLKIEGKARPQKIRIPLAEGKERVIQHRQAASDCRTTCRVNFAICRFRSASGMSRAGASGAIQDESHRLDSARQYQPRDALIVHRQKPSAAVRRPVVLPRCAGWTIAHAAANAAGKY